MQLVLRVIWLALASSILFSNAAWSDPVDCVPVGDPGNACDPQGGDCFGAVAYSYSIATYETTNAEYTDFLNAVAADDTNGVWNSEMYAITRSGSAGSYTYQVVTGHESEAVGGTRFYDALRYANWLHNGRPTGAQDASTTEDGAYTFTAPTTVGGRNPAAAYAVPSEDEWYKAAYYDPETGYYDYPTFSDTPPTCSLPSGGANLANCDGLNGLGAGGIADVGSYPGSPSAFGTFDQAGNVWEWNEAVIGSDRGLRGGAWHIPASFAAASSRYSADPNSDPSTINAVGFRVVCLPEPSSILGLSVGVAAIACLGRRHRRT